MTDFNSTPASSPRPSPAQTRDDDRSSNLGMRLFYFTLSIAGAILAVAFGAGLINGYLDAGGGDNLLVLAIMLVVWIALLMGLAALAIKFRPRSSDGPEASSVKKSRNLLIFATGIGILIGALLVSSDVRTNAILSNGPISPFVALVVLAVWLVITPIITVMWWRTTDEHEHAAYSDGANIAGHFYLFVAPGWWVATRAGLLPPQDPMVIFIAVASIWSAVWFYRKYM